MLGAARIAVLDRRAARAVVQRWATAVRINGGTVSAARQALMTTFVSAQMASGAWGRIDDAWVLVAEDAPSALTSLKQLRLASAAAGPTFMTDLGYAFTASQFIDTGYIPAAMAQIASANNVRLAVYERAGSSQSLNAAGVQETSSRVIQIRPLSAAGLTGGANTNVTTGNFTVASALGYFSIGRDAATAAAMVAYRNGVALTRGLDPTSFGTTLPATYSLYLGAMNVTGSLVGVRACTLGWVDIGALLTADQELAQYNAVQTFMTAVGANV